MVIQLQHMYVYSHADTKLCIVQLWGGGPLIVEAFWALLECQRFASGTETSGVSMTDEMNGKDVPFCGLWLTASYRKIPGQMV